MSQVWSLSAESLLALALSSPITLPLRTYLSGSACGRKEAPDSCPIYQGYSHGQTLAGKPEHVMGPV